jgi:alkylated DNA nucleotide flippase Atl1
MDEQHAEKHTERVRAVILAIPVGETMTYGEVAAQAGLNSARQVGRILAVDGHDLPWHRVMRADGSCAPQIAVEQTARLRAEGVLLTPPKRLSPKRPSPKRPRTSPRDG